jgi:hypothetical protein
MLLFSFLKQLGSCGHMNSHDHPHFCWGWGVVGWALAQLNWAARGTWREVILGPITDRNRLSQALAVHPTLGTDPRQPFLDSWNPSEVFFYVLFSEVANRNGGTVKVQDVDAKDAFGEKNPFRVMAEGAVAEVGEKRLRFVKPTVNREVILGVAAEFLSAAPCVFNGVSHS